MDASPANATDTPASSRAPVVPMLRAVLLCDIVESTALVERIGDARAATLMQNHDQLLRQALSICRGQLIDRADGVLALFERPIQALDFALRYQRALQALGEAEGVEMKARIGIHVGDVMMWANEPQDVRNGAKPFEVEGLAKPVAARLMGLALPGQILMSGMAQNLAHRAAGELGERAARLRWLVHGRYRFKGVPSPMLVHEVGEAGLAPLRAPDSGAKAWRELPLWRRPPVLAIEALMVGVLGVVGVWTTLRAPPAIAFAERDWVVVADLQNQTAEPLFDDALDMALRVGLEQSQYVNLVSELQVERALARMQRPEGPVDRAVATEVALREGARAVILPTVAEVGGVMRVSLEVIDPKSGVTVYSESEDVRSTDQVMGALDDTLSAVRGRLGETLAAVESTSQPLEKVTTADMEALRLFSLALQLRNRGRPAEALSLLNQAVERDPEFSMAWLRMGAIELGNDLVKAEQHFLTADRHRDRLTRREELLLDASLGVFGPPEPMLEKWRAFALLYPDEYRAFYNYSYFAHFYRHNFADAAEFITPSLVARNPQRAGGHYLLAASLMANNDLDKAIEHFELSRTFGLEGVLREHADAYAARRDYDQARAVLGPLPANAVRADALRDRLPLVSWPLDQGQWDPALAAMADLGAQTREAPGDTRLQFRLMELSLRAYQPDQALPSDLRAYVADAREALAGVGTNGLRRSQLQAMALGAGWIAAYSGQPGLAREVVDALGQDARASGTVYAEDMARIAEAELALAEGRAAEAVAVLADRRGAPNESFFLRAVRMRALAASGDLKAALAEAEWVAAQRGRAYAEPGVDYSWMLANLVESNLALQHAAWYAQALGDAAAAKDYQARFGRAWPTGKDLPVVARRRPDGA